MLGTDVTCRNQYPLRRSGNGKLEVIHFGMTGSCLLRASSTQVFRSGPATPDFDSYKERDIYTDIVLFSTKVYREYTYNLNLGNKC